MKDYSQLPFRQSIAAIILNQDNKMLVVTPSYFKMHHWKCISGGIDQGESEEAALIRELQEELGCDKFEIVSKSNAKMEYTWSDYRIKFHEEKYKGQSKTFFIVNFTGENKDIKLNKKENSNWRWVNPEKITKLFQYPGQAEFIIDIIKGINIKPNQ
jgi:putative (di)nucleoside polyphosphate hydrolase